MSNSLRNSITAAICGVGFAVAPCVSAMTLETGGSDTIVSKICGFGSSLIISIERGGDEDKGPQHHPMACHAVCTESEELEEE